MMLYSTVLEPLGAVDDTDRPLSTEPSAVRGRPGLKDLLQALSWIAPTLALIVGDGVFPAGVMFSNSTRGISLSGIDRGSVGFDNFAEVFAFTEF